MATAQRQSRKRRVEVVANEPEPTHQVVDISGIVNNAIQQPLNILPPQELLKALFNSETGDWTIEASDGETFKFHLVVLQQQVSYFQNLLTQPKFAQDCANKRVVVPQEVWMDGEAVEAFLRYIYYQDRIIMENSCDVTCSLIRAGHHYNIPDLIQTATAVINDRVHLESSPSFRGSRNYFDADELWKSYQSVWLWKEEHALKKKVMKSIVSALKTFRRDAEGHRKLLAITNGSEVLRDFILAW